MQHAVSGAIVGETKRLANHLLEIEAILAEGKDFIDTGWPSYAWGPYFAERFGETFRFTRYERGLYHWLEVNSYLQEQHEKPGFMGLYRYEEMYADEAPAFQFSTPDPALQRHVWELARRLGYSEELLQKWSDIGFLARLYQTPRIGHPRH